MYINYTLLLSAQNACCTYLAWCITKSGREGVDEAMLPELLPHRVSTRDEYNTTNDGRSDSGNNDERKTKLSYIQKEKKSNKRSRPLTKEK